MCAGSAGFCAFIAFDRNPQEVVDVQPMSLLAMSAPMQTAQIQRFAPMIHAAGIAGNPTALSLRQPLFQGMPSQPLFQGMPIHNLRMASGPDMTARAVAGEVPDMNK